VSLSKPQSVETGREVTLALSAIFFFAFTWASYARWANFEYRTFDLAYYVQAVWQLIHGRFQVSVENVPLLGNHVEPIVCLFAPLFAVFRHAMLFVVVQNAALAAMGPIGYNICRRLGFDQARACLLSAALLFTPAAGYVALHEFHPEALAAPFLLLLYQARLSNSPTRHWLWFVAALACKENIALLLIAYGIVQSVLERGRGWVHIRNWYVLPAILAVAWFFLCTAVITPAFNSGNIDYLALYDRLGGSLGEIVRNAIMRPQIIGRTLFQSVIHGNLFWGLLCPWLFLPLLRPRWLIITAPIFLQHLLSWRSSEWTIFFHYAAPLFPLLWVATAEGLAHSRWLQGRSAVTGALAALLVVGCAAGQLWFGSAAAVASATAHWFADSSERARKTDFLVQIPDQASVVAPLPYLSHLAMRPELVSLHYILKGLKTLSRQPFPTPVPTDFVLIDYGDSATFDAGAGFYHPAMKTVTGNVVLSSDRRLHDFLKQAGWKADSRDELTLLRHISGGTSDKSEAPGNDEGAIAIGTHTQLLRLAKAGITISTTKSLEMRLTWRFEGARDVFPWMLLRLSNEKTSVLLVKGLCAPEAGEGVHTESWRVTEPDGLPAGEYHVEALFVDNSKRIWIQATGGGDLESTLLAPPVPLGQIRVE
jgi:uncharacterized membrane protein